MGLVDNKANCCGCSACVQKCPKQCIAMREDEEGFVYPEVDFGACVNCGLCERVCPVLNPAQERKPIAVYAAKNPNEEIRLKSSSGGAFTAIAEEIIKEGGVVFGCRMNEQMEAVHDYAEAIEGLEPFRGSKYVQSIIGNTYKQAKNFLDAGRKVLFTGTPCQIAGLRLFLGKEYENLLLVDVICHGVPSPGVFRQYLKELVEQKMSRPKGATAGKNTDFSSLNERPVITGISFRDKRLGWKKYGFSVRCVGLQADKNSDFQSAQGEKIQEKEVLFEPLDKNVFMKGFLNNIYLRPSCYACPAKAGKSLSDITLGDFWGINSIDPGIDDDRGISVITVNTDKGTRMIDDLQIKLFEKPYPQMLLGNPAIENSPVMPNGRKAFFRANDRVEERIQRIMFRLWFRKRWRRYQQMCQSVLRKLKIVRQGDNMIAKYHK